MVNLQPPSDLSPAGLERRLHWYAQVARLAPSKHNSQPWRFVIADNALEVWADQERLLPISDPDGRELRIACGAAVHTAAVAAAATGVDAEVSLFGAEDGPLASLRETGIRLPEDVDRALLAAVGERRTDRGPLDMTVLEPALPFHLQQAAESQHCVLRLVSTPGDRLTLGHAIELAHRTLLREPARQAEQAAWVRAPRDPRPTGVRASASRGSEASYSAEFVQRDFALAGVPSLHDRVGADRPVVGVLCTTRDGREDWLQAGRALMQVLLVATVAGANASYLNEPLELTATRDLLRTELDLPGPAQLILRLGAGAALEPTPRLPGDQVVTNAGA
jgi:hypothetical protein